MSGHSKWSTIKRKKGANDAARAKVFTKFAREMAVAIKEGGADINGNSKLKEIVAKAKANNVPNDNIDRVIKKFSGDNSVVYDEITYEGYGPSGVAVIVKAATDNRNRTAGEVRHSFDKYGAGLGQNGCVSYLFEAKGVIIIERSASVDEDKLMECALEAGAEDFAAEEECFEIYTVTSDLYAVKEALEGAGYAILSAEEDMIPQNYITLESEDDIKRMQQLLDSLEDNDDVSEVYHNWEE